MSFIVAVPVDDLFLVYRMEYLSRGSGSLSPSLSQRSGAFLVGIRTHVGPSRLIPCHSAEAVQGERTG